MNVSNSIASQNFLPTIVTANKVYSSSPHLEVKKMKCLALFHFWEAMVKQGTVERDAERFVIFLL